MANLSSTDFQPMDGVTDEVANPVEYSQSGVPMTVIKIRIDFGGDRYIGHGRIQLLELIGEHGSIASAAKAMDMSYKRAWYLIDEFNGMFADPLLERQHGGRGGGAAKLTPFGAELIRQYRDMESKALKVFAKPLTSMEKHLVRAKTARK